MVMITFIAPILPGKSEAWRRFLQEMSYSRRAEYESSRRRMGVAREWVWIVETLKGEVAIIAIEAEQPGPVIAQLTASDLPFDHWFREQLLLLQGVDLTRPQAHTELVFEWYRS